MKLHTRVLLTQLPALALVVFLLAFGSATVRRLGGQGRTVLGDNYRSVVAAQRMRESLERLDSAALYCLADACDRGAPLVAEHRPRFEAELQVEEHNLTEPGEGDAAAALRTAWTDWLAASDRFAAADTTTRRALYFDELLPSHLAVAAACDRVLTLNQDAMVKKAEAAEAEALRQRRIWVTTTAFGLAVAIGFGVTLSRRLTGPLRQVAAAAVRIGEGQLGDRLPRSHVAELDAVAGAFNDMADRLRLYRRAADSELARSREAAQAAIESLVDPVLVLTVKGEVRAANDAARRLVGVEPGGRHLAPDGSPLQHAVVEVHSRVVHDGRPVLPHDFSGVILAEERAFLAHATPIHDGVTGETVGVTVLLQDVTRLRHLDELKGNLVNTVAHELRTPLTSLGMALHLALDERVSGPLDAKVLDLLGAAREDVRRLRALVEDLLDLGRLQGGHAPTDDTVDPAALATEVVEAARPTAGPTPLHVEVAPGLAPLHGDLARLRVALGNLVANALRHGHGTPVTVRVRPHDGGVRFEVEDRGPGVPEADRERIFAPFQRGEGADGEGAGLGLTLTREIVRAHGGRIGLDTPAGGGACFWVELSGARGEG